MTYLPSFLKSFILREGPHSRQLKNLNLKKLLLARIPRFSYVQKCWILMFCDKKWCSFHICKKSHPSLALSLGWLVGTSCLPHSSKWGQGGARIFQKIINCGEWWLPYWWHQHSAGICLEAWKEVKSQPSGKWSLLRNRQLSKVKRQTKYLSLDPIQWKWFYPTMIKTHQSNWSAIRTDWDET